MSNENDNENVTSNAPRGRRRSPEPPPPEEPLYVTAASQPPRRRPNLYVTLGFAAVALVLGALAFHWMVNRVYVPPGHSLLLRYKGPLLFGPRQTAKPGYWAAEGEIGVLERMRGPGRHFYCPIWWERTVYPDTLIKPGDVGVVTCKLGDALPEGEFLVDGEIGE